MKGLRPSSTSYKSRKNVDSYGYLFDPLSYHDRRRYYRYSYQASSKVDACNRLGPWLTQFSIVNRLVPSSTSTYCVLTLPMQSTSVDLFTTPPLYIMHFFISRNMHEAPFGTLLFLSSSTLHLHAYFNAN